MTTPLIERFWESVDKYGPVHPYRPELGCCWLWTACTVNGYGQIAEDGPSRKRLRAHRVSYEIHSGPIFAGLKVRHNCDNPPCVNPTHLLCGTDQDNSDDMVGRGRRASTKGEQNGRAKLTEEQVAKVRRDYVRGSRTHGQPALARKYRVSQPTIGRIVMEENWKEKPVY